MNFGFDEDQKSLGDTVAKLLVDYPALTAPDLVRPHSDEVWRGLAELGLFALMVPERFDGVGLNAVDVALAVEALGAGLAPPSILSTLAVTDLLVRHGSEEQQRRHLPGIAAGTCKFAIATLEADQGYDPASVSTTIGEDGLSGEKILVADAADAQFFLVSARQGGATVLALVDRTAAGVAVRPHDDIDPSAGSCAIRFERVDVGSDAIIGATAPERAIARLLDTCATFAAGALIGLSHRMLDTAVEYARTRVQFGQPIGAFQAIKHRCADMAVAVEAGRSAAYYAFWAVAEDAPDRARAASMAKAYCGEISRQVCSEAIQVHGGMGFTWELGLHRFLRRAKLLEHSFGDAAFHNERVLVETLAATGDAADHQLDAA
ncbi:acyl-CoA dehydrogenase family protein [Sphingomonas sp.]|jgi:alkylation response protein AidB-like acyl-CoA dehydrogenase|uniref:acyl-CoA dehydrogenase family protein n=1 Tax=Sphingomonas sp. TaxID=28214 RepID=UPI0035C7EE1B